MHEGEWWLSIIDVIEALGVGLLIAGFLYTRFRHMIERYDAEAV